MEELCWQGVNVVAIISDIMNWVQRVRLRGDLFHRTLYLHVKILDLLCVANFFHQSQQFRAMKRGGL